MLIYHGSYMEIITPDINYGRIKSDFGKGFYATTLKKQAEKWAFRQANRMARNKSVIGIKPTVNVYEFNTDNLNILSFDGYTEKWLDFVVKNRSGKFESHQYDAVYGNIADDDVVTVVNDYARLLRMGRITQQGKLFYLEQLQYSEPNNQYCIATQKAVENIKFIESYLLEE